MPNAHGDREPTGHSPTPGAFRSSTPYAERMSMVLGNDRTAPVILTAAPTSLAVVTEAAPGDNWYGTVARYPLTLTPSGEPQGPAGALDRLSAARGPRP